MNKSDNDRSRATLAVINAGLSVVRIALDLWQMTQR